MLTAFWWISETSHQLLRLFMAQHIQGGGLLLFPSYSSNNSHANSWYYWGINEPLNNNKRNSSQNSRSIRMSSISTENVWTKLASDTSNRLHADVRNGRHHSLNFSVPRYVVWLFYVACYLSLALTRHLYVVWKDFVSIHWWLNIQR